MTRTSLIKILIVDDHPPILRGLCEFLKTVPTIQMVATAKNAEEARSYMSPEIDLVIMDIRLGPGLNGIDLTAEFNAQFEDLAILIYSADSNVDLVRRARGAGARGYLLKGTEIEKIKTAIEIVMAGGSYLDPALPEIPKPKPHGETLTKREDEVMRLYAKWMTTEQISKELELKLSGAKAHRNNIMWKLGLYNTTELLREAIRRYGNPDDQEPRS